jgi:hypothetical protein
MSAKPMFPLFAALSLAACGSSSQPNNVVTPPTDAGFIDCTNDPRVSQYAPNLSVKSATGDLVYILLSSTPAPPAAETNVFSIKITDGSGVAQPNITGTTVVPFMPDMGHGTSIVPSMTSNGDGTYSVQPLYLFMAGIWSITFTPASNINDTAAFFFCVEG